MARRIRVLLLSCAFLSGCATLEPEVVEPTPEDQSGRVIEPAVERRPIAQPQIDTENFEVGAFAGIMSLDDFGSNPVYGLRAAYHIVEDLFVEGTLGRTEAGLSSVEELTNVRVMEDRDYTYYNINFGYNFLPGEIFLGRDRAMTSTFYIIGGVGGTRFARDDYFTLNLGVGMRILATDWLAIHLDARDHRFATDLLGKNKAVNNLEGHIGFSVFF